MQKGVALGILKQIWAFIIKIFKFLWGKDIEYTPDGLNSSKRFLKIKQIGLSIRRIVVVLLLIWLCNAIILNVYSFINFYMYNFNACRGKNICIIKGPDMNYFRSNHAQSSLINDKYVLLIGGRGRTKKRSLDGIGNLPELYDSAKNKFIKLPKVSFYFDDYTEIINDKNNNLIILGNHIDYSNNKRIEVYGHTLFNTKTLTFDSTFKDFEPDFDTLKKFSEHYRYEKINNNNYIERPIRKYSSSTLYILNPYKVVDLKKSPVVGKLFKFELENGDIIYVNKDSSYIFKASESKFVPTDKETSQKLADARKKLEYYSQYIFGEELNSLQNIPLTSNKFLFMCSNASSKLNLYDFSKKTILYDYENNTISEGPEFAYVINDARVTKLNDNKWLITGGGEDSEIHNHSQILIVKDTK